MVAIGNLPQKDFGTIITADTYSKPTDTIGQKIVANTTYWDTINGVNAAELEYSIFSGSSIALSNDKSYLASFALQKRYKGQQTITITVTQTSNVALYYMDATEPETPANVVISGSDKKYSYYLPIGSSISSFLLKINAQSYSYEGQACHYEERPLLDEDGNFALDATGNIIYESVLVCEPATVTVNPFIKTYISNFAGYVGYFIKHSSVEEFERSSLSSGYITKLVLGSGFNSNLDNEISAAQVPPSARASMQAATEENPTKNRVFDATLLLEQITAQFDDFREKIKTKVYNVLTYTVFPGTIFEYTEIKVADMVWDLLDKYGFGSVERIINWFNNEERLNMLADLVINDATLKAELGYNNDNGELNYFAVAKAGILIFAQWIHQTYIANSWRQDLWNLVFSSSYTLADLVFSLLKFTGDALTKVKAGLQETWDGIKAGGEYIATTTLRLVLQSMSTSINQLLSAIFQTMTVISPDFQIITNSPLQVRVNNQNVKAYSIVDNLLLNLVVGSTTMHLFDFQKYFAQSAETLSVDPIFTFSAFAAGYFMLSTGLAILSNVPNPTEFLGYLIMGILAITVAQITNIIGFTTVEKTAIASMMSTFHTFTCINIFIFLSMLMYGTFTTKSYSIKEIVGIDGLSGIFSLGIEGVFFSLVEVLANKNGYAKFALPLFAEIAAVIYLLPLQTIILTSKQYIASTVLIIAALIFLLVYHLYLAVYWRTLF